MTRKLRSAVVLLLFVAMVVGVKSCLACIDESTAFVAESDCCAGWKPCPDRKPVGKGRKRAVYWCGPDHPDLRQHEDNAPRKPSKPSAPQRKAGSVGKRGERPS